MVSSAAFIDGTSPSRASSYQVTQPQQNDVEEDESDYLIIQVDGG